MALTGLDYFALYKLIDDELPTNASNLIKAINTRNVTKRMTDTFFTLGSMKIIGHLVDTPPVSPEEGDTYTVGSSPTGVWAGNINKVAVYSDGSWKFIEPGDRLNITLIAAPEKVYYYRGSFPAGNWFYNTAGTGTGNLKSDGSVSMDSGYTPTTALDIATREFVLNNVGIGTVTSVNSKLPTSGDVTLHSGEIEDVSGIGPSPSPSIATSLAYLEVEKLDRSGSIPMVPGYTPLAEQDIATKKYVDNKPVGFAGKYEYLGKTSFPSTPPVLDDNNGEFALYVGEFGEYVLYMSAFDKEGYPFAFYAEAMLSNNRDTDGTFDNRYAEGAAITSLLSNPSGALTGLVKSLKRATNFEITLDVTSEYSFDAPNTSVSLHIETDLSYSRNRTWLNSSHFDQTVGPYFTLRSHNYVIEQVSDCTRQQYEFNSPVSTLEGADIYFTQSRTLSLNNSEQATQEIYIKNLLVINSGITIVFTSDIPTILLLRKVAGNGNLVASDNVTILYEESAATLNASGTGSFQKSIWDNTARVVMTAYIETVDELKTAMSDPSIHTIFVADVLFITEDIIVTMSGRKRITGNALYFRGGDRLFTITGGTELYCEVDIVIQPGFSLTYSKGWSTYFKSIYGNNNGEGGLPGAGGGIFNNASTGAMHYERLVDNVVINNTSSSVMKPWLWSDSTFSSTIAVSNSYELRKALESLMISTIICEVPIELDSIAPLALTRDKYITGAELTSTTTGNKGFEFSGAYKVKFYTDIVVQAGSIQLAVSNVILDSQVLCRNIINEGGIVYLTGISPYYEFASFPENVLDNTSSGDPISSTFWDNSVRTYIPSIERGLTTSIIKGGELTLVGASPTEVTVAAGSGTIVNSWATPGQTSVTQVSWAQQVVPVPGISTNTFSGVYVDATGTVLTQAGTLFSEADRRSKIVLGTVLHVGNTELEDATNGGIPSNDWVQAFMDYSLALGGIVNNSDILLTNANLTFQQTAGSYTSPFINRANPQTPSTITNPGVDPKPFTPSYRDGLGGYIDETVTATFNPGSYDDGGGTLATVGNNTWTYRPVYFLAAFNRLVIPYGQGTYTNKDNVIDGISESFDTFEVSEELKRGSTLLGFIVSRGGATNLANTDHAEYVAVGSSKVAGGSGANSFDQLSDTPATKVASKWLRVNAAGTLIEYVDLPTIEPSDGNKGDITVSSSGTSWGINADSVDNNKLANSPAYTMKGNTAAATGNPQDLSRDQIQTFLAPPRIFESNNSAGVSLNVSLFDGYQIRSLAQTHTILAPSGSATTGRKISVKIKDNGVQRTLIWDAIFRGVGVTLPTTTIAGKVLYAEAVYNDPENKWDIVLLKVEDKIIKEVTLDPVVKTLDFTATVNTMHLVDVTAGDVDVSLPALPGEGDIVVVSDSGLTANVNTIAVIGNGNNIDGFFGGFSMDTVGQSVELIFTGTTWKRKSIYRPEEGSAGGGDTRILTFSIDTWTGSSNFYNLPATEFSDGTNFLPQFVAESAVTITGLHLSVGKVSSYGQGEVSTIIRSLTKNQNSTISYGSQSPVGSPESLGAAVTTQTFSASETYNGNQNTIGETIEGLSIAVPANVGVLVGVKFPASAIGMKLKIYYTINN